MSSRTLGLAPFRAWAFLTLAAGLLGFAWNARAQTLEPRAYANSPSGLNFVVAAYGYVTGDVLLDPSVSIEDVDAEVHTLVLAYVRTLAVRGKSAKIQVTLPYGWLSGSGTLEATGEERRREVSGLGDTILRFSVNLHGAPALPLERFRAYRQDLIVGVSLVVSGPTGQYDPERLVNIGTNRWSFKPEVGISKALGRWKLEGALGATVFKDNDDFFGGQTRQQDPIYSVQGHLLYTFPSERWVGLNATYYEGGRTTTDGVEGDDLQQNWRAGVTLALPIDRRSSLKLYGSSGVSTRSGSDFTFVGAGWQYLWGAGH
jgi:hypothetical protein